jgi:hypothetical protein|tara:strand:+ start:424 stop:642 length:219 start_codon:yes stop_codon:yes gene_type:complete
MVTIILAMASITWLFGKNRALIQLLEDSKTQDVIHVDRLFDLERENADLLDDVLTLELDNAVLNDSIVELNK